MATELLCGGKTRSLVAGFSAAGFLPPEGALPIFVQKFDCDSREVFVFAFLRQPSSIVCHATAVLV